MKKKMEKIRSQETLFIILLMYLLYVASSFSLSIQSLNETNKQTYKLQTTNNKSHSHN